MARASTFMNYLPKPDRYDEVFDAQGRPRGHWERSAQAARRASRTALSRRAQTHPPRRRAGWRHLQYLRRSQGNRPALGSRFSAIRDRARRNGNFCATAVAQRARLMNRVLGDLYGAGRLLAEGLIPPAIIHGHHNYLWPCRGIEPPGGTYLHFMPAISRARPMAAGG